MNGELDGLDAFIGAGVPRGCSAGRTAGGDRVSLARGPHREAHVPRAAAPRRDDGGGGLRAEVLTKQPVIAARRRGGSQPAGAQRQAARRRASCAAERGRRARWSRAGTFEYAIRKDVRNNPIVREVDEQRQRELWQSLGIGVVLVLVLLFSAWQHFELLRHGYRLEQMQRERAAEDDINRHLRLEIETLRAPQRIEKLATERLGMVAPGADEAVVLERVAPPAAAGQVRRRGPVT